MKINGSIRAIDGTSYIPRLTNRVEGEEFSGFWTDGILAEDVDKEDFLYYNLNDRGWKKAKATSKWTMPARALSMKSGVVGDKIPILLLGTYKTLKYTEINNNLYLSPIVDGNVFMEPEEYFPNDQYCQKVGSIMGFHIHDSTSLNTIVDVDFNPFYFKYHGSLGLVQRKLVGTDPIIPSKSGAELAKYMPNLSSGIYWFQPDGVEEPFEAYVNMDIEGGGWVLAGTMANDGNNYWTWNNFHNWDRGNDYGSIATAFEHDYQHKLAWTTIKANQILLAVNNSSNKYLRIDSILSNQTISSKWPSSTTNTSRYGVAKAVGSWWYQCGLGFALCHNDSDGYGDVWAVGFVAYASNNNGCYFDDNTGGMNSHSSPNSEIYRTSDFWGQNVPSGSVMNIYIR